MRIQQKERDKAVYICKAISALCNLQGETITARKPLHGLGMKVHLHKMTTELRFLFMLETFLKQNEVASKRFGLSAVHCFSAQRSRLCAGSGQLVESVNFGKNNQIITVL